MKHWEKLAEEFNGLKERKATLGHVSTTRIQKHKKSGRSRITRRGRQPKPAILSIHPENCMKMKTNGARGRFSLNSKKKISVASTHVTTKKKSVGLFG